MDEKLVAFEEWMRKITKVCLVGVQEFDDVGNGGVALQAIKVSK